MISLTAFRTTIESFFLGKHHSSDKRGPLLCVGVVLVSIVSFDLSRSPPDQRISQGLIAAVRGYRLVFSKPLSLVGVHCRFKPTCSRYAEEAITNLGAVKGCLATMRRLLRCGPWTKKGTIDRPPAPPRPRTSSFRSDQRQIISPVSRDRCDWSKGLDLRSSTVLSWPIPEHSF